MPNRDQLMAVGQSCSEYVPVQTTDIEVACDTCKHWKGKEEMCELDIYLEQLLNLDQT